MTRSPNRVRHVAGLLAAIRAFRKPIEDRYPGYSARVWARGQARAEWPLVPLVHRHYTHEMECALADGFRLKARTRQRDLPAARDFVHWLPLMRHYGLPTRLLDWSESPLVAAFFAVAEASSADGAVWVLDPMGLIDPTADVPGVLLLPGFEDDPLLDSAFLQDVASPDEVKAVLAEEVDLRMTLQQSAFTIHGTKKPLEEVDGIGDHLMKLVIPASAKGPLRAELAQLGVRRRSLFPDLANLALDLAFEYGGKAN